MKIDVTQIIVVVITALVIPFIKVQIVPLIQAFMKNIQTKFTVNQWNAILKLINDGVEAAETFPEFTNIEKSGTQKFAYVLKSVIDAANKMGFTYDETAIKNATQSAWKNLIGSSSTETKAEETKTV